MRERSGKAGRKMGPENGTDLFFKVKKINPSPFALFRVPFSRNQYAQGDRIHVVLNMPI